LIDNQVLCVHGGLSPQINTLDQIRRIERNQEIPCMGAFCDLVWSDPEEVEQWVTSSRGAGYLFGAKITQKVSFLSYDEWIETFPNHTFFLFVRFQFKSQFMHTNDLTLLCRAHQLVQEGYKYMFDDQLITVWSAPNYCYRCGNVAAVLEIKDVQCPETKIFHAVPQEQQTKPESNASPYFL
jgi:serine/threonine-protein phosphatase 6 catalytic subunit